MMVKGQGRDLAVEKIPSEVPGSPRRNGRTAVALFSVINLELTSLSLSPVESTEATATVVRLTLRQKASDNT